MALTNMIREPRRELTESAIGLVVCAVPFVADCYFAAWIATAGTRAEHPGEWYPFFFFSMLLGALLLALGVGIMVLTHAVGNGICNALERQGLYLRPRVRKP